MRLRDIQSVMTSALIWEDDFPDDLLVVDGIAAADRLGIHRNTVLSVLIAALRATYPAIEALVGSVFFDHAAALFIEAHPPASACLNDYGEGFGETVAAAASLPYLADVARLEWAVSQAATAPDVPALDPDALETLPPADQERACFMPHPSVRLIEVDIPADTLWRAVLDGDDETLGGLDMTPRHHGLIVHRLPSGVTVRPLSPAALAMTRALLARQPLGAVLPEDASPDLMAVFAAHLGLGCFTRLEIAP